MGLFPGQRATQTECLILGNGPSLVGRDWGTVPRERVFVLGVNQSWREVPDADAHFAIDVDQYAFDDKNQAGFGGREYYMRHSVSRTAFHTGAWDGLGVRVDRHDALIFSRHPFRKRHRGAHHPKPALSADGGVALKVSQPDSFGSSAYIALQMAAACDFERIFFVGLDLAGGKFKGAIGYADKKKTIVTTEGAWSNSERHDRLWRHVPADVKARTRVIAPSATQQFQVIEWPWKGNA